MRQPDDHNSTEQALYEAEQECEKLRKERDAAVAQAQALREAVAIAARQLRFYADVMAFADLSEAAIRCNADADEAAAALAASEAGKERTWTQQTDSYGNPVAGG